MGESWPAGMIRTIAWTWRPRGLPRLMWWWSTSTRFSGRWPTPAVSWETAIETIDIGGPAMVRAAAKNHAHVSVLTDPGQYPAFLEALAESRVDATLRRQLALAAFSHTAAYDAAIARWFTERASDPSGPPSTTPRGQQAQESVLRLELPLRQSLRYGENPHQHASWFAPADAGLGAARQLQGKELSYNNLMDLEAALATVREFGYGDGVGTPAAVVIKHTNPCGAATGEAASTALARALDADRVSAFGGIVAINRPVDAASAEQLAGLFLECVVAPEFEPAARERLAAKGNLRLLELDAEAIQRAGGRQLRSILGGVLVQDWDDQPLQNGGGAPGAPPEDWTVLTARAPSEQEWQDLLFCWKVVRHVRSNAIAVARDGRTLGIGAGQMNRVGSARIALEAAGEAARGGGAGQ